MNNNQLYVVGRYIKRTDKGPVWEFIGVYDSEEKARKVCACIPYPCFIGPAILNVTVHDHLEWPNCYYPYVDEDRQFVIS